MAFGQQAGPPATARQVRELLELLNEAGHADFRDARGPLGFTQRQAGGKFTRDEADAFIEQLQRGPDGGDGGGERSTPSSSKVPARNTKTGSNTGTNSGTRAGTPRAPARSTARAPIPKAGSRESGLSHIADADLAAELQRRGWIVVEP